MTGEQNDAKKVPLFPELRRLVQQSKTNSGMDGEASTECGAKLRPSFGCFFLGYDKKKKYSTFFARASGLDG